MTTPAEHHETNPRRQPELLAPAGDRDCVRAAVENGADAVYFGLECGFNARVRATNLHLDELPDVMALLHGRGVKGYVTLNTLVFPGELDWVEQVVVRITDAGADAVLVQDLGLARMIMELSPDLPIHASTQMTLTSAECIRAVEDLGIQRVVLARELSLREISKIHRQTNVELETFVHGALCVAYSGQCLTSESLGGRSANRGHCAQACRLPYDLICDDRDVELGPVKYLLSPQDLAAYALVPDLIDAGVASFKIEGRLKTPEYVANITRHYRRAIDAAMGGRPVEFTRRDVTEMELSFSRGFSPGWLNGCDHKMLVPGLSSAKRGVLIGEVVKAIRGQRVLVCLTDTIARGDGVVFEGDREHNEEQGGRIYEIFRNGQSLDSPVASGNVEITFGRGAIQMGRLLPGQRIWKTDDPRLTARLRKTFAGSRPLRHVPLDLEVNAAVGARLRITGRADNGAACRVESDEPLAKALKHPATHAMLVRQLGRLGNTTFELRNVTANIHGQPMVPLSVLGKLRSAMVAQLDAYSRYRPTRRINRRAMSGPWPAISADAATDSAAAPELRVLCRSLEQLGTVIDCGVNSVIVDFQDIREYRAAVQLARQNEAQILLATPRIQKPDEMGIFRAMRKHGADGLLVRNLAAMLFCAEQQIPFDCDFSLNAANQLTVEYLRDHGARTITVSYDLNRDQLLDLVAVVPCSWLEVVIHQHMPMFHMEHCVFCAVLSPGTNKTNCGRPCDHHQVRMRDRIGMEHILKADVGCRNTLFNAVPQSAAETVPALLARGLGLFRVELAPDDLTDPRETIQFYRDLLAGDVTGKHVWQQLNAANRVGVTRGTLEERRNPLAIL